MTQRLWSQIVQVWQTVWQVWLLADRIHLGLIAAGIAFFSMFSLFPAVAASIALFGLVADPGVVLGQLALIRELVPPDAYDALYEQTSNLLNARAGTLTFTTLTSLVVALWLSRAAVAAMMRGLNAIHDRPMRGGLRQMMAAFTVTFSLIGVGLVALLMVVVAPVVLKMLPLPWGTAAILEGLRWAVALAVMLFGLGILYRFGPNRRGERPSWVSPGAVLVIVVWMLSSAAFSFYVANFGKYNEVYGSIGAAMAMLFWLYLSAYLVLFGAALNVVIENRSRWAKVAQKEDPSEEMPGEPAPPVP